MVRYWSLLDASIIHLRRTDLFKTVIPSKLFECMAMGIPVLHGVEGESAEIVTRDGVGLTFPPEDAAALRDHLVTLAQDDDLRARLGRSGVTAAQGYDRAALAANMLSVISGVARTGARGPGVATPDKQDGAERA